MRALESARSRHELEADQINAANLGHKAMMPLRDATGRARPFVDFIVSALADAGYRDIVFVVAPGASRVRDYLTGEGTPSRVRVSFAEQVHALGTADAVRAAAPLVAERPFIVINGDNLYPVDALEHLARFGGPGLVAFERDALVASSGFAPDRVAAFALVEVDPQGTLRDVVEKPTTDQIAAVGSPVLVSMNCWRFDRRIVEACDVTPRSERGEMEIPTAVRLAKSRGVTFDVAVSQGPVWDLSGRADIPVVQAALAGTRPRT